MLSFRRFLVRFAIALVLVVAVTSVGVVAGNSLFEREFDSTETVDIPKETLAPEAKGEPANFLVVGSDTRAIVDNEAEAESFGSVEGQRSDVIMVVHVDPDTETGFVVAFPRDLWVQVPGHGTQRLNAAFGLGGPELVIQTLQENFDVPIHHYLEVDFDGFRQIVNTVGGVNLLFNAPARDAKSGLDIPEAGCRELNGDEALAYARSRYYEAYDAEADRWRKDPRSDLSRIERQQYFLRSLANTAISKSGRNPVTAYRLVTDVFDYLKRDPELDLEDVKGLINAFRDLDPASIEMTTLPTEGADRGGAAVQVVREEDAAPLLARLRSFGLTTAPLPEPVAPGEISIRVLNGSGEQGEGSEVVDALLAHGFSQTAPAEDADRDDYPVTHVRYAPGLVGKGLTVAVALGTADVQEAKEPIAGGADVEVVVGTDWDDIVAPVKEEPPPPTAGDEAADSADTTASTEPAVTTTTPTTRAVTPREAMFVPVDPETGGPLVGCP